MKKSPKLAKKKGTKVNTPELESPKTKSTKKSSVSLKTEVMNRWSTLIEQAQEQVLEWMVKPFSPPSKPLKKKKK